MPRTCKRSDRLLIKAITKYPKEVLSQVSESAATVKTFVYWPLVYNNFNIGALAALALTYFKFYGEIVVGGLMKECGSLAVFLFATGFLAGVMQVFILNNLMKWYD